MFLAILVVLPMFNYNYWSNKYEACQQDLWFLQDMYLQSKAMTMLYVNGELQQQHQKYKQGLISIQVQSLMQVFKDITVLRPEEVYCCQNELNER